MLFSFLKCEQYCELAWTAGFEPAISRAQAERDAKLRYVHMERTEGFEPSTTRLEGAHPFQPDLVRMKWSTRPDSNRLPPDYETGARPSELRVHLWLPVMGSNHVLEVQSPASCHLDEPGILVPPLRIELRPIG